MKSPNKRSSHIAVLDADPAILNYVRSILGDRFVLSLFTEASEFNRFLGESPSIDLVLMDWCITENETEENALSLLRKTHAFKPSLPIIVLACSPDLNDAVAVSRMGATDLVLKPFTKMRHRPMPCSSAFASTNRTRDRRRTIRRNLPSMKMYPSSDPASVCGRSSATASLLRVLISLS